MTIDQAIELLAIVEDIDTITADTLRTKKRAAQARWHPDKAPSKDETTQKRYTENFQNIDIAVDIILKYQKYGYIPKNESFSSTNNSKSQQREEQDRQAASTWKSDISKKWENIKQSNWRITKRDVLLSDGFLVRDFLKQDLIDRMPIQGFIALFSGFYTFIALSFVGLFLPFIFYAITPAFIIYSILCSLVALPLARVWLPDWLLKIALEASETGYNIGIFMSNTPILRRLIDYPFYFSMGVFVLFITPIYNLVGRMLKDKVVGIQRKTLLYFGDFELPYVESLIKKEPKDFKQSELDDLFKVYNMTLSFS